jgi:outer membrane protein TolC
MKFLTIILLTCLSLQAVAKDYALQVYDKVESVLEAKDNAISLEQAKEMVLADGIDVKIAYERLFQAQRKIGAARALYFPYGIGDVAAIYFTQAFTTLLLVELGTSIPSKWYNVQKEKHLRNAAYWDLQALEENIKNQTALLYYNIVKEKSMLELTSYELNLLEELFQARTAQANLGLYDVNELDSLKFRILNLRDEYLKFEGYLNAEMAAYKMLLNLPYDAKLELQPVNTFLSQDDFTLDVSTLNDIAQNRSYEIKSAEQVVLAAYDAKRSAQWSILSFSGIGFGYLANIRISGSKITEAKLRLESIQETLYNNVYSRVSMFEDSVDYFLAEKRISDTTKNFMDSQMESFNKGDVAVSDLIEAELYFLRDFRDMLRAHYNAYVRLDDLERIVLGSVSEMEYDNVKFSLTAQESDYRTYLELVDFDGVIDEVESVTYTFDDTNLADIKSFKSRTNFRVSVNNRKIDYPSTMTLKIIFKNGEVKYKKIRLNK